MAAAVFTILVWSSAAFAVDTATMNVTSEPIHYQSPSDKGGGLTFTFDAGTTLAAGDIITGDLSYGVVLAQSININVGMGGSTTPWTGAGVPLTGSPFTRNGVAPTQGGNGIYFNVTGNAGSQRVTITVMGVAGDSLTVGPAAGVDQLVLTILDQAVNADYTTPGIYYAPTGAAATLAQNTLCINVSGYTGTTVLMSMDSAGDKFTFVPSNPEIAHVVEALNIAFSPCKGQLPGYIPIGSKITQGSETCVAFDNDHEELPVPGITGVDNNGFCVFTHVANDIILGSNIPFDIATYTVKLEILVNGATGNNGVYFSNEPLAVGAYNTKPACGLAHTDMTGTYVYLNGLMAAATPAAPNYWECDVASTPTDRRAVTLTTDATAPEANLGIVAGTEDWLAFNLPAFNYDLDEITAGDVVSVRITISKIPCGTIFVGTWQIGTFGCQSAPQTSGLLFPYFTPIGADADNYWDGMAITNPGLTATTTVVITVFEADGDQGTYSLPTPIAANSQYVNLLSSIPFVPSVGNTGTLGDDTCYIRVNVTGVSGIDGFGMMADRATGESMGYLPRQMSN